MQYVTLTQYPVVMINTRSNLFDRRSTRFIRTVMTRISQWLGRRRKMAETKTTTNRPSTDSPEPNCAICLGSCTNKCFSDSCMHQFCFKCLLEWSKVNIMIQSSGGYIYLLTIFQIKAECPLCKQPFRSIIHNVKSNDEYDEHVVETIPTEELHIVDEQYMYLPTQPTRHQFHFRYMSIYFI